MPANYSPWIKNDRGFPLQTLDNHLGFTYTKVLNGAGWFSIVLPVDDDIADPGNIQNLLSVDRQVQIWRRAELVSSGYLDFFGFIRKWTYNTAQDGGTVVTISGPDQNELLERRIVAYAAGTDEAETTVDSSGNYPVDDSMVAVVRENLADLATDTDRSLEAFGFDFGFSPSFGMDIEKGFAWREVSRVLSDLNGIARANGQEVFYMVNVAVIDSDGSPILHFGAFDDYPGGDRSWGEPNAQIFGLRWGNLSNPVLSYDYSNEVNYVYVGGAGEGEDREIVELEDTQRIGASIWNRREKLVDARTESTTARITSKGYRELNLGRPVIKFNGTIHSTQQTPYGEGWNLGSLVTIEYRGLKFNGVVKNIQITVSPNGDERVTSSIEYVEQI
jgi:hypothetical protein